MKRALIIVALLIVIIGGGVGVYFFFFAPSAQLQVGSTSDTFPSGSSTSGAQTDTSSNAGAGTVVAPNLVKITDGPVAGGEAVLDIAPITAAPTTVLATSTASTTPTATSVVTPGDTEIRYIDRESGNIYAYRVTARSLTRMSDKTLPGIQEASWVADGSLAFVRFIASVSGAEQVDTYALPFNGSNGFFLSQNLAQVTATGSSTVFTLSTGANGSIGSIAHADGTGVQTLFTSPLSSITTKLAGSLVLAVTKASAELDGYAFTVSNGRFTPIIGPYRGLTVLPNPSGTRVLFSYVSDGAFVMNILDLSSGVVTKLPLATLAEKCVWANDSESVYCAIPTSPTGTLPDDWYQGAVSFNDRIWHIDLNTHLATLVLDPEQTAKIQIDAVNLTIDPNSQVLVFRNKIDSSLWSYSL